MSIRLHSATQYKVHYGPAADFANVQYELNQLMFELCDYEWDYYNGEDSVYSDEIHIDREVFDDMLAQLDDITCVIPEGLLRQGYTAKRIRDFLETLRNQADPTNDYIVLVWY
jgi:hypothetical protein